MYILNVFMYKVNHKTAPNVLLFKNHLNNQFTILKQANTQFQLGDHISEIEDKKITTMH